MSLIIHRNTFVQSHIEAINETRYKQEIGTVDITFGGERMTVEATRCINNDILPGIRPIYLQGFVGRYRTGTKVWCAVVYSFGEDHVGAMFGRDERSGRCQKLDGISYNPTAYKTAAR